MFYVFYNSLSLSASLSQAPLMWFCLSLFFLARFGSFDSFMRGFYLYPIDCVTIHFESNCTAEWESCRNILNGNRIKAKATPQELNETKNYEQIEMRMLNDNKQTQIYTSLSIQLWWWKKNAKKIISSSDHKEWTRNGCIAKSTAISASTLIKFWHLCTHTTW